MLLIVRLIFSPLLELNSRIFTKQNTSEYFPSHVPVVVSTPTLYIIPLRTFMKKKKKLMKTRPKFYASIEHLFFALWGIKLIFCLYSSVTFTSPRRKLQSPHLLHIFLTNIKFCIAKPSPSIRLCNGVKFGRNIWNSCMHVVVENGLNRWRGTLQRRVTWEHLCFPREKNFFLFFVQKPIKIIFRGYTWDFHQTLLKINVISDGR